MLHPTRAQNADKNGLSVASLSFTFAQPLFSQNIDMAASLQPASNPAVDGQSDEKTEADERLWRETGYGGFGDEGRRGKEEGDRGPPWRKNGGGGGGGRSSRQNRWKE